MRILILTQWFDPEPVPKGLSFAKELSRRGHDVAVLTGFPHYPTGKVYEGFAVKWSVREIVSGISVRRMYEFASHDRSPIRRAWTYLSFALSASWACLTLPRPDVVYVYHPPASIALPAFVLKYVRRSPFVYDVQDLWPDTLSATEMTQSGWIHRAVERITKVIYAGAARIVVLSPGFKSALVSRGVPENKVQIIYNWADEDRVGRRTYNASLARELGLADRFNVMFSGNMGVAQKLETVLEAAAMAQREMPRVQFVLVGSGTEVERLKRSASERHLENVRFLPRRPMAEISEVHALADVLLVHLKKEPLFAITIPSKTQAYMACGRPVLMGVTGDAADLVRQADCGVCCEPENPESLLAAVRQLYNFSDCRLQQMSDNALRFYTERLSLKAGTDQFERLFEVVRRGGNARDPQ